jgi:hypothetical protein
MNRKRWTKILMGAVCGVMLTIVSTTGWTRTAFICEGRIGNAATNPGGALGGDFEFDISTNTAAPAVIMQFAWTNGVPVEASIRFDASSHEVTLTINGFHSRTMAVDPTIFDDPNGLGFLNFRNRAVNLNSSVELTDLKINIDGDVDAAGQPNWIDLDPLGPTIGDGENLRTENNLPLQRGFTLNYKITFRWDTNNPPGRSRLASQIGANEYPEVASVTLKEVDPDTNQDVDPVAADSPTGNLKLGNPESHGGGLMFFAEKNTPDGSVHNKLKAVAKLTEAVPSGTTVTVHFKIFDMDDPTQDFISIVPARVNIVDPNDLNAVTFAGGDNYRFRDGSGFAALPTLSADSVTLNPNEDTASITFEIPENDRRPGNNWKVVAHTDLAYLNDVEVDRSATSEGLGFRLNSNQTILVPVEFQSELVSLWRTIHLEFDKMHPPSAHDVFGTFIGDGYITGDRHILSHDGDALNMTLNTLEGGVLRVNGTDAPIELSLDTDDGGYREINSNGLLNGDSIFFRATIKWDYSWYGYDNDNDGSVDENALDDKETFLLQPEITDAKFAVNTDDPIWNPEGVVMPSQSVPVLRPPNAEDMITSLNGIYNPLYIRCVQIDPSLNVHSVTPQFRRQTRDLEPNVVDVKGDTHSFWSMCIVWAYEDKNGKTVIDYRDARDDNNDGVMDHPACGQEFYLGDNDPRNEGVPRKPDVLPNFIGGNVATWLGGTKMSGGYTLIFLESNRDFSNHPVLITVAHEMAHQLGAEHALYEGEFLPDDHGIMFWDPPDRQHANHIPCNRTWFQTLIGPYKRINPPETFSLRDIQFIRQSGKDMSGSVQ